MVYGDNPLLMYMGKCVVAVVVVVLPPNTANPGRVGGITVDDDDDRGTLDLKIGQK